MPIGSEGARGRIKEAVGRLTDDPDLQLEGEVERKRHDAELATKGWSQPRAHVPEVEEAHEAEIEAEERIKERLT